MKKTIALLLSGMMLFSLCACGKSEAAQAVDDMIAGLGPVYIESETFLNDIKSAYDALSEKEQTQVENMAQYQDALDKFNYICEQFDYYEALREDAVARKDFYTIAAICDELASFSQNKEVLDSNESLKETALQCCYEGTYVPKLNIVVGANNLADATINDGTYTDPDAYWYSYTFKSSSKMQAVFDIYLECIKDSDYFSACNPPREMVDFDHFIYYFKDPNGDALTLTTYEASFMGMYIVEVQYDKAMHR